MYVQHTLELLLDSMHALMRWSRMQQTCTCLVYTDMHNRHAQGVTCLEWQCTVHATCQVDLYTPQIPDCGYVPCCLLYTVA